MYNCGVTVVMAIVSFDSILYILSILIAYILSPFSPTCRFFVVVQYRTEIENELEEICNDILDLLDKTLLAADEISDEAQVFYYKMKGDYLRYLAEVQTASTGGDAAPKAKTAYEQAWLAAKPLKATNPIKLGLALNFSVFHYEILSRQDSACTLAKEVYMHHPHAPLPQTKFQKTFEILLLIEAFFDFDYWLHKNACNYRLLTRQ